MWWSLFRRGRRTNSQKDTRTPYLFPHSVQMCCCILMKSEIVLCGSHWWLWPPSNGLIIIISSKARNTLCKYSLHSIVVGFWCSFLSLIYCFIKRGFFGDLSQVPPVGNVQIFEGLYTRSFPGVTLVLTTFTRENNSSVKSHLTVITVIICLPSDGRHLPVHITWLFIS